MSTDADKKDNHAPTEDEEDSSKTNLRRRFPGAGVIQHSFEKTTTVAKKAARILPVPNSNKGSKRKGEQEQESGSAYADGVSNLSFTTATEDGDPLSSARPQEDAVETDEETVFTAVTTQTIVIGPVLSALTADWTIVWMAAIAIAVRPTLVHWNEICQNQLPWQVVAAWLLVAFGSGQVFSIYFRQSAATVDDSARHVSAPPQGLRTSPATIVVDKRSSIARTRVQMEEETQTEQEARHKIFSRLLGVTRRRPKIRFVSSVCTTVTEPFQNVWTNLRPGNRRLSQRDVDPTRDKQNELVSFLVSHRHFRRSKSSATKVFPADDGVDVTVSPATSVSSEQTSKTTNIGQFDVTNATADSLDDYVIDPLFRLRGMDVFLTDELEDEVATHPWLIANGLRDVPTFVVNTMTQWGHILVYFEMPKRVKDWDNVVEEEGDEDGVKAFKRFCNGDDDYRNARMKFITSITDGPLAVRLLAPPKKEKPVHCNYVSVGWKKFNAETTKDGRKLCPVMEVTLDCVSNPTMRRMAGIVKRSLSSLSIDVAIVVTKPLDQKEDEPQACIGLWRLKYVDISSCPEFPDRMVLVEVESGQDPDVFRATKLVHLSEADLAELVRESDRQ